MGNTTEELQVLVDYMMAEKGVSKYKLNISGSSSKGDGYLGEISFIKIICDLGKGEEKVYDIVIKSAKTCDDLRKNCPIVESYLREIYMYTDVLPVIEKFQKENAIENRFVSYAKCYSVCRLDKQEAVLLINLKSVGYVLHDRMVPQNFEHITFVFRVYARWHGSSLALKTKNPKLFEKITADMTDTMGEFLIGTKLEPLFKRLLNNVISLLKAKGKDETARKIETKASDTLSILCKMTLTDDRDAEKEAVILHGDCWNNNMMFKYKGTDISKPSEMVFLDLQMSRVASPIFDLSYYFYAVADKSSLDKLDYLLEDYHQTLSDYLMQYNIKCDDILSLERLKESWKKYGRYGLALMPFIIRTELCQEDEVLALTDRVADNTMLEMEIEDIRYQQEFETRIVDVFNHFAERFL